MSTHELTLYHSPQTRGTGVLFLLEELGVPYQLKLVDINKDENHLPEFLAVNPLGKFPTLVHNGTVVTEQVACYLHLADLFPEKGLAPAMDDPQRGAYMRWMAYYGSSFEPAVIDRALKREPGDRSMMAYGTFEVMQKTVFDQIAKGPYLLGDTPYAVDLLWGIALRWCRQFGLIDTNEAVDDYIARITARPAFVKAEQIDQALVEESTARQTEEA
ncbi:glutathione S-transferase family protein [Saccharospirillum salsuginis]|uniref:Glutathione S-transferase n=1 Tax=Saccharospirillum salsuginis TaxID=418750 RepID=A0A918K2G9_9GAMM|nr:glutathione S-transferase family protein [Saccharospirillum salsuginis]GGX43210.1 glutathione S-transferase [Saccharospirillum salsuginis]